MTAKRSAPRAQALTTKQRAFIEYYLANGFNATQAALSAGYSAKSARSTASENLTKPNIKAVIDSRIKAMAMGADEAMARLSAMGRGDLREFVGLSSDELKAHPQGYLLHKVKRTERTIPVKDSEPIVEERVELEMYNAQHALLSILKEQHLKAGEPTDRAEHSFHLDNLTDEQLAVLAAGGSLRAAAAS